jgi:hypothetical protein
VRGPNAHMRGHIAGSRPLVLGSPPSVLSMCSLESLRAINYARLLVRSHRAMHMPRSKEMV